MIRQTTYKNMVYRLLIIFLLFSTSIQSQGWKQANNKTNVVFKIKNFGVNVDGSFKNVVIETNLSKGNILESKLKAKILIKSIETGIESRDKHLFKEDYFHEEKYKTLELTSIGFSRGKNNTLVMEANLTMKGITKKIKLPLLIIETEKTLAISSDFVINRKDFNIGGGTLILSKKVKVRVEYFGTKPE